MIEAKLERNTGDSREIIPYHVIAEITGMAINRGTVYQIPIYVTYHGRRKHFHADLFGFRVEDERPFDLPEKIGQFLERAISASRLPTYVFIARRAKHVYPVYTLGDEVFCATPKGGPVFRHVELAKVREYLTDYLHDTEILGENGLSDKLHVRGIDGTTLGLRRPVFYLKKRVVGEVDFWAPVFESGDKLHIYTYAASDRRQVPIEDGREVLLLRSLVADLLRKQKRIRDLNDLRPDRLMPRYWEKLSTRLTAESVINVGKTKLPLFSSSYGWLALEERPEENRFSLYVGSDPEDVQERAQKDFLRRGIPFMANGHS